MRERSGRSIQYQHETDNSAFLRANQPISSASAMKLNFEAGLKRYRSSLVGNYRPKQSLYSNSIHNREWRRPTRSRRFAPQDPTNDSLEASQDPPDRSHDDELTYEEKMCRQLTKYAADLTELRKDLFKLRSQSIIDLSRLSPNWGHRGFSPFSQHQHQWGKRYRRPRPLALAAPSGTAPHGESKSKAEGDYKVDAGTKATVPAFKREIAIATAEGEGERGATRRQPSYRQRHLANMARVQAKRRSIRSLSTGPGARKPCLPPRAGRLEIFVGKLGGFRADLDRNANAQGSGIANLNVYDNVQRALSFAKPVKSDLLLAPQVETTTAARKKLSPYASRSTSKNIGLLSSHQEPPQGTKPDPCFLPAINSNPKELHASP